MNVTIAEHLFPPKVRCKPVQYMSTKTDTFYIKFLLESDVHSKYILNSFLYLGTYKQH